jgi:hypothetical protein
MTWTRAHDAWIARECEGLEVLENMHGVDWICFPLNEGFRWRRVSDYNTDPAACIRAAEAWRKKGEGRTVKIEWDGPDVKAGLGDRVGGWHQWFSPSDLCATALAQALYRATGGPA